MTLPILITSPDQVAEALEPVITVGGLIDMLADLAAQGVSVAAIVLHPMDAATVIEELNDHGSAPDKSVIGIIQGVPITQHEHVSRGSARVVPRTH